MKTIIACTLTAALLAVAAPAAADPIKCEVTEKKDGKKWYVTLERWPTTVDEFKQVRDDLCKTPQGSFVAFVVAMKVWGENEKLGFEMLPLILDKSLLVETEDMVPAARIGNYKGWQVGKKVLDMMKSTGFKKGKSYTAQGYVSGTSPDTGYKVPAGPMKFVVRAHGVKPKTPDEWRGFLNTTGASRPKPYWSKKNGKGVWKILKTSSYFAGTAPPKEKKEDDDL